MALTDTLESYWKLDETTGNRNDSVTTNHLTVNGPVSAVGGKWSNAAQFTRASSTHLLIADNASLSTGDIDFTIAAWVYMDSKPATNMRWGKWGTSNQEWSLVWDAGTDRFGFSVSNNGSAVVNQPFATLGAPSTGTWYLLIGWHDSVNNLIGASANAGTADTTAHSTGVFNGTAPFVIGAVADTGGSPVDAFWDGRIDEVGFWKRVLSGAERTELYNSGAGLTYPFTPPDFNFDFSHATVFIPHVHAPRTEFIVLGGR